MLLGIIDFSHRSLATWDHAGRVVQAATEMCDFVEWEKTKKKDFLFSIFDDSFCLKINYLYGGALRRHTNSFRIISKVDIKFFFDIIAKLLLLRKSILDLLLARSERR